MAQAAQPRPTEWQMQAQVKDACVVSAGSGCEQSAGSGCEHNEKVHYPGAARNCAEAPGEALTTANVAPAVPCVPRWHLEKPQAVD